MVSLEKLWPLVLSHGGELTLLAVAQFLEHAIQTGPQGIARLAPEGLTARAFVAT